MKVYLSPSGQIHNEYAYGKNTEADICRKIATKCSEYLTRAGIENKVAKPYNNDDEWKARCDESDAFGADYHVPIHTNAGGGHGVRIFVSCTANTKNAKVTAIFENIKKILPEKFRTGSISVVTNLYEINKPKAKSIYIECAFHDNEEEAKWIVNNIDELAMAIATGLAGKEIARYDTSAKLYRVQVGAYAVKENAEKMQKELESKGYSAIIKES